MNLTLERDALHAALGRVARIVETRTTIQILSHLHLEARDDRLRLRGTDLDIEVTTGCAATIHAAGLATAPARLLADVVAKLPAGAQLRIERDATRAGALLLRSGRGRTTLHTLPAEDFPEVPALAPSHTFEIAPDVLLRLLGRTAFAMSGEETRYYLNGTFLHAPEVAGAGGTETRLRAVATDGHRLARCDVPAPAAAADGTLTGCAGMPGIIVPKKAVAEIRRLAKDADGPITIAIDTRRLAATFPGNGGPDKGCPGETVLATKLIDGTFPDYQRVVPTGNDRRALVDRAACMAAAERVACVSAERGRAAKLAFADGALVLSVKSPDAGDAADEIEVEYTAAPIEIGFNVAYLGEILGTLEGDRVAIAMADAGSPTLFREVSGTADRDDLLLVLMPMRV